MHLRVADAVMYAAPAGPNGIQLYDPKEHGKHFSIPITRGEAGWEMQWVTLAVDFADAEHKQRFPERWTAYVKYVYGDSKDDYSIEEIDFDTVANVPSDYLRQFCEGVLVLDYDSGWTEITLRQQQGMYL